MIAKFTQDPSAILDYTMDWTDWLSDDESGVFAWMADSGITIGTGIYLPTTDGETATVWLSGVTDGLAYEVTCQITTDSIPPRIDQRSIMIFGHQL